MHTRWLRAGALAMLACAAFSAPAQVPDHGHGPAPRPEHFDARTAPATMRAQPWPLLPAARRVRAPAAAGAGLDQPPERALLLLRRRVVCAARTALRRGAGAGGRVRAGAAGVLHDASGTAVCRITTPTIPTTTGVPRRTATRSWLPPEDVEQQATTQPPPSDDLFVYPQHGQSDEQQSTDKYECHKWAAGQSGFDPTQSGGGVAAGSVGQYAHRATSAP